MEYRKFIFVYNKPKGDVNAIDQCTNAFTCRRKLYRYLVVFVTLLTIPPPQFNAFLYPFLPFIDLHYELQPILLKTLYSFLFIKF